MLTLFLSQGCATKPRGAFDESGAAVGSNSAIMVAGVVKPADQGSAINQLRWTTELEEALRSQSPYDFIAYRHTQRSLGQFHQRLLTDYQDDEFLSRENLSLLTSSGFPARYILLATLDTPAEPAQQVIRHNSRNSSGEVVGDRSSLTYSSQRDYLLTGALFDIHTGNRIWRRTLASKPVASRTFTQYHGSSFAGSLAAMVANRFVNGSERNRYPAPPPSTVSMRELARELVYQMFNGPNQI